MHGTDLTPDQAATLHHRADRDRDHYERLLLRLLRLRRMRDMLPAAGEAYVMFNNIPRADDARRFGALLGEGLGPDPAG